MKACDGIERLSNVRETETERNRVEEFITFVIARHAIYKARQAEQGRPWTKDPILRQYKFCNIYRELDRVTRWISVNWRQPNQNDPDFWFASFVARRCINLPATLSAVGYPIPWKQDRFLEAIERRSKSGKRVFNSDAYKVIVSGQSGDLAEVQVRKLLNPVWGARHELRPRRDDTLRFIGNLKAMSERVARREHARIMEKVNEERGSIAPVPKGQSFVDAVAKWRLAIAPNLSPATVRPRESFLRAHIMPKFGKMGLQEMGVGEIQQFATDLRQKLSGKTVVNILGTMFTILDYAERCGMKVRKVGFTDLQLGSTTRETPVAFFTRAQATDIIAAAEEPFKTLFSIAWCTGMRAGELLALTLHDLDFTTKTIRVNKSSDDRTREIRQPKTKASVALLPMPSALETALRNYMLHWPPNASGILFATRDGSRPRSRANVVRIGLKPVLLKLGISTDAGLHAFRHGLATELAEASVPIPVLQQQLRHADVKTTLKVYAHVIPQTQRDAMENIGGLQSLRSINTLRKIAAN